MGFVDVEEGIFVHFKIGETIVDLVLWILEAFAEPVVAKPWGGMNEGPPFIGEINDRLIS